MRNIIFDRISTQVGLLYFNRPQSLNSLDHHTLIELNDFLSHTLRGIKIRVLILTGKGEQAFASGADLSEINNMSLDEVERFSRLGQQITLLLEEMDIVTIAAINGYAFGAGLELAIACDIINASDNALLGLTQTKFGLISGFGGMQRLPRLIGINKAKELIFTGENISGEEALRIGLVNNVYPKKLLIEKSKEKAEQIAKNSFYAVTKSKKAINRGINLPMNEALLLEQEMFTVTFNNKDRKEGIKAFLEKREPEF